MKQRFKIPPSDPVDQQLAIGLNRSQFHTCEAEISIDLFNLWSQNTEEK